MSGVSRRTFLRSSSAALSATVAGGAAALWPVAVPGSPGAAGRGGGSRGAGVARTASQGGGALPVPPLLEGRAQGGVRLYELTAQRGRTGIFPGTTTATYGYNRSMLGPLLRLTRGERVRIEVTNRLDEPTTCHWHGLHVPAVADGGPRTKPARWCIPTRPLPCWRTSPTAPTRNTRSCTTATSSSTRIAA